MSLRPGPEPPPRRRGNGLPAEIFVPLADVEPRLGEHLLDLLKFHDIAAFLEPPADPRAARRPGIGMVERLYVESPKRAEAREVVQAAAAEAGVPGSSDEAGVPGGDAAPSHPDPLAGIDTDAEFARLIAGFDEPPATGAERRELRRLDRGDQPAEPADDTPPELQDEHYEPPPPPPLPRPAPPTVAAVAVFGLGIVVVAKGAWLGLDSTVSFPLGVILVLTGFGMLVMRLRASRGDDDDGDPDDGAVI